MFAHVKALKISRDQKVFRDTDVLQGFFFSCFSFRSKITKTTKQKRLGLCMSIIIEVFFLIHLRPVDSISLRIKFIFTFFARLLKKFFPRHTVPSNTNKF